MRRLVLWLGAAALLMGCSPARLAPQVSSFSNSIAEANAAMNEGLAGVRADLMAERTARAVALRGPVSFGGHCATSQMADRDGRPFPPCIAVAAADTRPIDTDVWIGAAEKRRQMAILARYAAALAAVTDASDSQALAEATDSLAGSAMALAAVTGNPQAAAVGAAVGVVGTVARLALDAERMAVLQRTVRRTDDAVGTVAEGFGTYFATLRDERLRIRNEDDRFRGAVMRDVRPADYAVRFNAIQERGLATDAIRAANPRAAADAMKKAHSALVAAANDPNANAAAFAAAVAELADAVKELRAGLAARSDQGG